MINAGFDYGTPPPNRSKIDADVAAAAADLSLMQVADVGGTGGPYVVAKSACLTPGTDPASIAAQVAGCETANQLFDGPATDLVSKAEDILSLSSPFMAATTDALPRERELASEIASLKV